MNSDIDLLRLLKLRMLTSALAGHFERTLRDHLSNLAVMLHPRALLGDLIRFEKSAVKDQDAGLRELSKLYLPIARNPAINVQADLKPPLDIHTSTLDLIPASYSHTPEGGSKPITSGPFPWNWSCRCAAVNAIHTTNTNGIPQRACSRSPAPSS